MGYRSIKQYLGETNLERKCRFLFGAALIVLIGSGFWWVDSIGEKLAVKTTDHKGTYLADIILYDLHWDHWTDDLKYKQLRQSVVKDLHHFRFQWKILSTDIVKDSPTGSQYIAKPENADEDAIMVALRKRQEEQLAEQREREQPVVDAAQPDPYALADPQEQEREWKPVFDKRIARDRGKYYYYQPVYWKESCILCHEGMYGKFSQSAAETVSSPSHAALPFYVVKVTLPYEDTRQSISQTRAILLTVGILTVVLAMGALWVIVRYVIVKPLNHLRDVTDAISHGFMDQRAEINTGDEFEELAQSFNKMLRHLVDTQAEIRNINHDLDAKVDELARLNLRLYEMNRMKSDFLANMSHELRTPLNSIIGFSEVIQGIESLTDKQRRYAQNIQKSGRTLLEMINDILDLAKLEAGQMELRLTEFQLDRVIHAQCDMVRSLTDEKNIDLVVNIEPDLPTVYQDQSKLQQILTNLLSNAIKFTPEGGRITVSARSTPQGMIEMAVADTGVGIAEADREIIFEKFRQGTMVLGRDTLTREYSGTGLGLSIVRELCKLMRGEISLDSELGRGSTFTVTFPWMALAVAKQSTPFQEKLDDLTRPARLESDKLDSTSAGS